MQIVRYTSSKSHEWDEFIESSRNGTFLFMRAYMDYHSDRFTDHSLMYYNDKDKLIAIMPANEAVSLLDRVGEKSFFSHQGLTYGGFILDAKVHISEVGELFETTIAYLKKKGFSEWYYKQMPSVYHKQPSQEDEYWLWRHNAEVTACNMMSAIDYKANVDDISSSRKRTYCSKLMRQGYTIDMAADVRVFWPILESNLKERFNSKPVHTLDEIELLQSRFSENIVCCTVNNPDGKTIAGTLLFISDEVVRTQYISASPEGKQINALDYLMLTLVGYYRKNPKYRYFEFGTSMAEDGINLNEGLILQKEGFGGRAIACKTYRIKI